MIDFEVQDMTCGHCVRAITEAVRGRDAGARVDVDLAHHHVRIDGATASPAALAEAIRDAGYTPVAATPGAAAPGAGE